MEQNNEPFCDFSARKIVLCFFELLHLKINYPFIKEIQCTESRDGRPLFVNKSEK